MTNELKNFLYYLLNLFYFIFQHFSFSLIYFTVVVVITFFLCWFPFHIQRLLFTYIEHSALSENVSFSVNTVSGVLFFVSTCINPFLYNIMSAKFRDAFKVNFIKFFFFLIFKRETKMKEFYGCWKNIFLNFCGTKLFFLATQKRIFFLLKAFSVLERLDAC